ncbi:MAG TPA: glycosyltransferase family 2 protein [Verrucomicrobiota bacterium]|nr:glycosyltransferase family 2 protein [Verrucomicrobiota bacterium]HQL78598.1 glycosyltransferase family 2 protein [Verrucomicrobiota bacterium]
MISQAATAGAVDYSIVIPVYYNEGSLEGVLESIRTDVIRLNPGLRAEVIFVDDGSGDGSFAELQRLQAAHRSLVRIIKLTRNFGQVNALLAGYSAARGRCVVAISADGQDPPRLINQMLAGHFDEGYEVVVFARSDRDESFYRRATSALFYGLIRKLSFPQMPPGGFDLILMGRRALEVFLRNRDANLFLQGQVLWTGFKTKFQEYARQRRTVGRSRWTFGRKVTYLIDGVMSFSYVPIRFMSLAGVATAALGFAYAGLVFFLFLVHGHPVKGWTPIVILILLLGGTNMLMLGMLGEYVWRTLSQVRNRDPYVIEAVYENDAPSRESASSNALTLTAPKVCPNRGPRPEA